MFKFVMTLLAVGVVLAYERPQYDLDKPIEWSGGNFDWPCETTKSIYKSSGRYIGKNVIATKNVIYGDHAILALPRLKSGVPATLARMSLRGKCSVTPLLQPFPSWSLQEEGKCAALQSVVDIFLDIYDTLWVLDTGIVNSLEEPIRRCPPKVIAIDPRIGKTVKMIDLSNLSMPSSRLQNVIVDYTQDGRGFVYVTDAAIRSILVYDLTTGRSHRVILPKVMTNGCGKRDVLQAALIRRANGTSCLLITYLSSSRMFSLSTKELRNGSVQGKIYDLGPKPKKMVILGTDSGSAIFFRYESDSDIYRWDASRPFHVNKFQKISSGNGCLLATTVTPDYSLGRMRVLKSNFPDFLQGTIGCGADQSISIL